MVKQQPNRRGRRSHTAKCEFCGKEHGDGAPWWNKSKDGWSITFKKDGKCRNNLLTKGWGSHDEAIHVGSFNTNVNVKELAQYLDVRCRVTSERQSTEGADPLAADGLPSTDANPASTRP